jgi:putative lipoic acid-binding regulatory protein
MASKNPPETETGQQETLLEFPCKFPVKAMGRDEGGFEALITDIVLSHAGMYAGESVTTNLSSTGKYLSVTVTVAALSKAQLDRIYQDLTDCEQVVMAL